MADPCIDPGGRARRRAPREATAGQLTVEGPFYDNKDSVLAITGGTGVYQQVRRQMTLHARNARGSKYDFV